MSDLSEFQPRGSALHASILSTFEHATEESYHALEDALTRCRSAQEFLDAAAKNIADGKLKALIDAAAFEGLEEYLKDVEGAVEGATQEIVAVELLVKDLWLDGRGDVCLVEFV